MSEFEDKNSDSVVCHNDQDDLAMYELSSSPSIHKEKQPIYVDSNVSVNPSNCHDYGDSDDDSDVIVIDTTATILAEKISAEYDCLRPVQECHKPTKRQRNEETTKSYIAKFTNNTATDYEKQDRSMTSDKQNNNCLSTEKKEKERKLKPHYNSVFEGCNSFEPIEIDDDSEDEGDCNHEDDKRNCGMAGTNRTSFSQKNNHKITTEASTITNSKMISAKIRKTNRKVLERREEKEEQSHRNKFKRNDAVNLLSSGENPNTRRDGKHSTITASSCALTSKTDAYSSGRVNYPAPNNTADLVNASNENVMLSIDNSQNSFEIDEEATLPQPTFEVINLTGEYDDYIGTRTNQEEKTQRNLNRVNNSPGGAPLSTPSVANEVPKTSRICETKKALVESKEEMVELDFTSLPASTLVGKLDCSSRRKGDENKSDSFVERINNYSHHSRRQVEVIDVDEIEHIECEVEHDEKYQYDVGIESEVKGTATTINTKPRFKPNKNKRSRKSEKESNSVTEKKIFSSAKNDERRLDNSRSSFRSSYRHSVSCLNNEEHIPKKTIPNSSIYHDLTQNNGNQSKKLRPNLFSKRNLSCFRENRFVFHPSNGKPQDHHSNNFLGMNIEDARKEQDRLLKKAADRVRNQPVFHVTNEPSRSRNVAFSITFSTLVRDVHLQYPDHFKYGNFYSRLGLPRHASESMIKTQYRRLARVYHPDRNIGKPDTRHKFQAVSEGYNHLMNA